MRSLPFFIVMGAVCVSCGLRQTRASLDSLFTSVFPESEPGAAVLVMQGDKVVFDRGYGLAVMGDGEFRADGGVFFNIASVSKQFTAVAVLQLVSEGKIALDDPVGMYFPEYTDSLWQKVRISHLLSHSSGIPDERGYLSRERKIEGDETLALEYLSSLDHLNFEPGSAYEYINPTFVLLGKLVERISGEPFTDYMRNHVFMPAGMEETLYFDRDRQELIPKMAHGYEYTDTDSMPEERTGVRPEGTKDWQEYDFGEETFFATRPDGGIYTSTREFVKWEKALRRSAVGDEGALLPSGLIKEAWTPHTLVYGSPWSDYQNRPGTWYGYGWFIEPGEGGRPYCIYHTGDNGGFKILAARYPGKETLVLIFAARADWDRNEVKIRVEDILNL